MGRIPKLAAFLWVAPLLFGQVSIDEIKIHSAVEDARVRPFETVELQVRVYGKVGAEEGRLRRDGAKMKVLDDNGGWMSKPFRFQGTDDEGFVDQYQSRAGRIFGQIAGQYVLQDGFLYSAPEKPGDYRVEAELEGHKATLTLHVDQNAPSRRKQETTSFDGEPPSLDPYRDLAEHYAPVLAQETWFQPKSDYPVRFDYDGDWDGGNNWKNMEEGSSQAYVHYAVMETATHWFLIYNIFHARDYSDKCVAGSCHENDNEGLILTVAKDGGEYGRLLAMETLAHNNVYSFTTDRSVRSGVHNIDGRIEFYEDHHPVVFIESGGHGVYGTTSSHARYDVRNDNFTAGTGITFVYKGVAERPKHANDRLVGYELLPIYYEWWLKTDRDGGWRQRTFDEHFPYQPVGGRPGVPFGAIGGSFWGREQGSNKAKPFWGWHDNRTKKRGVLGVGQWGLDPAYAVSQNLRFPGKFSTDYVFNPYLQIASAGAPTTSAPAPAPQPAPAPTLSRSGFFEFRVWVDGSLEAFISGDRVRYQVLSGAPFRDPSVNFSEPMPPTQLRSLRLSKKQGRGKVQLVERPSAENGWAARVRIDDPKRSGTFYHVRLEWQR